MNKHLGTAMDLQVGDVFGFGALPEDGGIRVGKLDLTDAGLLEIGGVVAVGAEAGHAASWRVQFDQKVEYRRSGC